MKPEWMPPLPNTNYELGNTGDRYTAPYFTGLEAYSGDQMHDYALAAVEAYRKSLKPVAWVSRYEEMNLASFRVYTFKEFDEDVPLYRLDGGNDDAA